MRTSRRLNVLAGLGIILLLGFLLSKALSIDNDLHNRYNADLLQLKESDASLDDALLQTRYGLLASYDPVNLRLAEIRRLQTRLAAVPAYIDPDGRTVMKLEVQEFSRAIDYEDGLIQKFKSQNAILNNSLRYFPVAVRNLSGRRESVEHHLVDELDRLLADTLHYSLTPDGNLASIVSRQIEHLGNSATSRDPLVRQELLTITGHAKTIVDRQLELDQITKDLIKVPTREHAEKLYTSYNQHYDAAVQSSNFYKFGLYIVSVALLGLIILKLRTIARALKNAKQGLEQENQERNLANTALRAEIVERQRAEEQVDKLRLRNESVLKSLVEAQRIARLGSFQIDLITRQIQWSENMWEIYGIAPREHGLSYREYLECLHPDDRELWKNQLHETLSGASFKSIDYRILHPKLGVRVIASDGKVILGESGEPIMLTGIHKDITLEKEMEAELRQARDAALESVRLKSEFLANMSHEIRTPMNGVIGMTGILLDSQLNAGQRDCAETIRASADALLTVINDILDFSKIEAGKLEFEVVDFDLRNAVEETMDLLAVKAREKQLEFASLVYQNVPTALRGDPGRLRQVLTNLVGNALKFTQAGEVVVRGELLAESEATVTVRFSVSDTGIGISEATQAKLFHAFTQADGSTTRKYGGTGLGLSISKQLVEMMGGKMGVTSALGAGATFWFTVDLEKQAAGTSTDLLAPSSVENLRVLIVDDNTTNRKILSHQLDSWGTIHSDADSGVRALELLKAAAATGNSYDLAILDLLMPDMDGLELARQIKADTNLAGTRLVLLTSGLRLDAVTVRDAGIAASLNKPVRQSQLLRCLTSVVSDSGASDPVTVSNITPNPGTRGPRRLSSKLILLAEDKIVNQKVALYQLEMLGYRADAVANGLEAVEALSRVAYDLVLMDCQMPEMDGYEATATIRSLEGDTKHTPIVAMTAHALSGDREKSLAAGMDDHITKPIKPSELARILSRFCGELEIEAAPDIEKVAEALAPVDLDHLLMMVGGNKKMAHEILSLYRSEMTENLIKLETAITSADAEAVYRVAHDAVGTSANCGMLAVLTPLRDLERMGRENQLNGAETLRREVENQFQRITLFLNGDCKQLAA